MILSKTENVLQKNVLFFTLSHLATISFSNLMKIMLQWWCNKNAATSDIQNSFKVPRQTSMKRIQGCLVDIFFLPRDTKCACVSGFVDSFNLASTRLACIMF